MGITKLADLIRSEAPDAVSYKDISDYTGKVIALDASVVLNQFRAATPSLSPLTGLFFRTLTFLEHDIKPVFVFDGKPPVEKTPVLERRAEAAGWSSPKRTGEGPHNSAFQAPGDAEAQCARLVRDRVVDAVASEDMDTLPFGANVLIRQLNAKKDRCGLLKLQYLVDLCILLGCDYCDKIPGLGPKKALTLIQKHRTIENVVLHINRQTYPVPLLWKYKEARKIFLDETETPAPNVVWRELDEEAVVDFLCHTKHVREERIRHRMKTFHEHRENRREERKKEEAAGRMKQTRMDYFFRVTRKRGQVRRAKREKYTNIWMNI
uniref:Zgc:110269 n=1 Tax=Xiphophorus couchianus TaxID=32473 RepID=A0A3B5LBT0_9TELE